MSAVAYHWPMHQADIHDTIRVRGARENNLRSLDVDIAKRRLTVVTGVSGSGKSSLVFGTVAAESRRLIDETYSTFIQGFMPSNARPDADTLENLSPAIIVDQERMGANSRSTVGTATDANAMLRMIFSRLSVPHVGPSTRFSFNLPDGMCPTCEGTGVANSIDLTKIVDEDKSLNEGAIIAPGHEVDQWYWQTYGNFNGLDSDKKIRDYTDDERELFLYSPQKKVKQDGKNFSYEGLITRVRRLWVDRPDPPKQKQIIAFVESIATSAVCPDCHGDRLNEAARTATVNDTTFGQCTAMEAKDLREFVRGIEDKSVKPIKDNLQGLLDAMVDVGLGYISLDRSAGTLSGGEAQRVKMVRHLGSALSDVTYVFDEPTVGLHPHDIARMNELLLHIRDKGNTVLVVEHKPEVIAIADQVIDIGPGSGSDGGTLVYSGPVDGLRASGSVTGRYLDQGLSFPDEERGTSGSEWIVREDVSRNNVSGQTLRVPRGALTSVTGVAGSGKSSLISAALGEDPEVLFIDQSPIRGSRRSSPATYTGLLDGIRAKFAKSNGVKAALFSANSEGACPKCNGAGVVYTDLSITAGVSSPCEECEGKRFRADVLVYTIDGPADAAGEPTKLNISDVLDMSVAEASKVFTTGEPKKILGRLVDVGLGYIRLGQPLTTLSGGERQRLKLAAQMGGSKGGSEIIVLDEPTAGLHLADTDVIIGMLHNLVESGRTVVAVEHNMAVMAASDHIIDVGPGAGSGGGTVVFEGTPRELAADASTLTGQHLAAAVGAGA